MRSDLSVETTRAILHLARRFLWVASILQRAAKDYVLYEDWQSKALLNQVRNAIRSFHRVFATDVFGIARSLLMCVELAPRSRYRWHEWLANSGAHMSRLAKDLEDTDIQYEFRKLDRDEFLSLHIYAPTRRRLIRERAARPKPADQDLDYG